MIAIFAVGFAVSACADTVTTIDFENTPALGTGPVSYPTAGPAQTITVPGVATITGGVVLGLASALPGVPGVTPPNIYGTASDNVIGTGGFGLPDTITIDMASGMVATIASVPIINGLPIAASFTVTAFDGGTQIDEATYPGLSSGSSITALITETAMTSLAISPVDTTARDFAVDTIQLTESPATQPVATPEPGSFGLAMAGLAAGAAAMRARRARPRTTA